jgi:transposase-like protein
MRRLTQGVARQSVQLSLPWHRDLGLNGEHRQHKGLNDRAENSHQPDSRGTLFP